MNATQGQRMELDDMKLAWQTLDRRLEMQNALNLHQFKESRFDKMRRRLLLLSWGQSMTLAFGIACTLTAGDFWFEHRATPHLLIAGLIMHLYGIAVIVVTARTFWLMSQIDYSASVITIQHQLAELRRYYLRTGWRIGLPWLLLWVPFSMVICALFGVDLYLLLPKFVYFGLVSGLVGILLTYVSVRWIPWPAKIAKAFETRSISLDGARGILDEIARFERD